MLEGEQPARAAEARLHLVDGEERPVAPAELLRAFEIARRRQVHALALDRLDDEERDVLAEQLTLEGGSYHYYVLVTNDHERSPDELERWHRAKANVENRIKEAKLGLGLDNLPCRGFHANWAYLLCTLLAYNLLCWLKLLALPPSERTSYAKRLRFRFIAIAATVGRSGRRLILRLAAGYPLLNDFLGALQRIRTLARAPA